MVLQKPCVSQHFHQISWVLQSHLNSYVHLIVLSFPRSCLEDLLLLLLKIGLIMKIQFFFAKKTFFAESLEVQ